MLPSDKLISPQFFVAFLVAFISEKRKFGRLFGEDTGDIRAISILRLPVKQSVIIFRLYFVSECSLVSVMCSEKQYQNVQFPSLI